MSLLKVGIPGVCLALASVGFVFTRRSDSVEPSKPVPNPVHLFNAETAFLKRGNPALKQVALTFDDGPHPESIELILKTLSDFDVPATFFLVGKRIEAHPSWATRIVEGGHEVGNHSFSHRRLTSLSLDEALKDVRRCEDAFKHATGREMSFFRPPGMRHSPKLLANLKASGYRTIGWTDAVKDFETESIKIDGLTVDEIGNRAMARVRNGSILLLHDTKQTAAALPRIIASLRVNGFEFVSLTEMLDRLPVPVGSTKSTNPSTRDSKQTRLSARVGR